MSDALTPEVVDADERALATTEGDPKMDTIKSDPLTLADRCDGCGAQAFVRVTLGYANDSGDIIVSELLFCGHDFAKSEAKLREAGLHVQDERSKINVKPSMSANAL